MEEDRPKRKAKHDSTSEHKKKKKCRRHSSSDSLEECSSPTSSRHMKKEPEGDAKCRKIQLKGKKKEKKHKHKKEKSKKKKKRKLKKHKHNEGSDNVEDKSIIDKGLDKELMSATIEPPKIKRLMTPMTKEEYEKQQSTMKHVLDPETGRYRLIKGDGEVMEEIVSHSRHRDINKLATKGDGASFQRMLGLG